MILGLGRCLIKTRFRIFGNGKNKICFTHVDNYCHGLIIAEKTLYPGSPALGNFYIVTDMDTHTHKEGYIYFYEEIDKAIVGMGFDSVFGKVKLPKWLLYSLAYPCLWASQLSGVKFKLSPFTVTMMTMHRWFDCSAAERWVSLLGISILTSLPEILGTSQLLASRKSGPKPLRGSKKTGSLNFKNHTKD